MALGPTGDFPRGKLNQNDEGALNIAIGCDEGVVKIVFGKKVAWVGLPKAEAIQFADLIRKRAEELP